MATAVTLSNAAPGDLINVKGVVCGDVLIEPRKVVAKRTHRWGPHGESEIIGGHGGRSIHIPVLIYDDDLEEPQFTTARKLSDFIDYTLNTNSLQLNGTLKFFSESDHSEFLNCTFDGAEFLPGGSVHHDVAGIQGGGYIAVCLLHFRQLTDGEPQPPPAP